PFVTQVFKDVGDERPAEAEAVGDFAGAAALRLAVEVGQHQDRVIDFASKQRHTPPGLSPDTGLIDCYITLSVASDSHLTSAIFRQPTDTLDFDYNTGVPDSQRRRGHECPDRTA